MGTPSYLCFRNIPDPRRSKLQEVIVDRGVHSGAVLFPLYGFQLESMTADDKRSLKEFMKKGIRRWACPPGLTRDDLLLVHSRIMAAKWMMLRFEVKKKDDCERHFVVDIDGMNVNFTPPARIDFAIEQGVDHLALQQPRPNKSDISFNIAVSPKPLDDTSTIRTSNCVFLGAFSMSRSGDVDDTAIHLVKACE